MDLNTIIIIINITIKDDLSDQYFRPRVQQVLIVRMVIIIVNLAQPLEDTNINKERKKST